MRKFKLSPSALSLFLDCPRCFWLDKNKNIKRPRGIFPSLPSGMDLVIKIYFDKYRLKNELPPEIKNILPGALFSDINRLNKWRSWFKTDLKYEDLENDVELSGALDDCLVENGKYIPLDYKTRGSKLRDDPRKYYQTQLDCYCLILESSGFKTNNLAYLLYFWPLEVLEGGLVRFQITPIKVETNLENAKNILKKAVTCLRKEIPDANPNCEYCKYFFSRNIENNILC